MCLCHQAPIKRRRSAAVGKLTVGLTSHWSFATVLSGLSICGPSGSRKVLKHRACTPVRTVAHFTLLLWATFLNLPLTAHRAWHIRLESCCRRQNPRTFIRFLVVLLAPLRTGSIRVTLLRECAMNDNQPVRRSATLIIF